jgi:uncharacterized protein (TIGR03067 family)
MSKTGTSQGTITIYGARDPKQIDMVRTVGKKEIKSIGIYKIAGDKLTLCDTRASGVRPKAFTTKGGTFKKTVALIVFRRLKKAK